MGGSGTWYLAYKHPERFEAIAPIFHDQFLGRQAQKYAYLGVPWRLRQSGAYRRVRRTDRCVEILSAPRSDRVAAMTFLMLTKTRSFIHGS
jgi:hypothetical protein